MTRRRARPAPHKGTIQRRIIDRSEETVAASENGTPVTVWALLLECGHKVPEGFGSGLYRRVCPECTREARAQRAREGDDE